MATEVIRSIPEMRRKAHSLRGASRSVGFVPTMGALHEGHLSLMRRCRSENDVSVVSIFVNPTQFAPGEDFEEYPRPFDEDLQKAEAVETDIVFTPTPAEMVPPGYSTYVTEERITAPLCGRSRPVFFRGVLTVVLKLFRIVLPDRAYFGLKDYQQFLAVRKMAEEFHLDVEVIPCPTVRDRDGLAISSRNEYLSPSERADALVVPRSLDLASALISGGLRDPSALKSRIEEEIGKISSVEIDYVEVLRADDLEDLERLEGEVLVALAVSVGGTRLIDSRVLSV